MPNINPVAHETVNAAASTRASTWTSLRRGTHGGANRTISLVPNCANNVPSAPPITASTMLSVRSWRISRPRLAPSAMRARSSASRLDASPMRTVATFAQAISNRSPAAARRITIGCRAARVCTDCSVARRAPCVAEFGEGGSMRLSRRAVSSVAASIETVRLSRTTTRKGVATIRRPRPSRRTQYEVGVALRSISVPGGSTPTIEYDTLSIRMRRHDVRIARQARHPRFVGHERTGIPPSSSSSRVKPRPSPAAHRAPRASMRSRG